MGRLAARGVGQIIGSTARDAGQDLFALDPLRRAADEWCRGDRSGFPHAAHLLLLYLSCEMGKGEEIRQSASEGKQRTSSLSSRVRRRIK